jgi:hypothetical protein
MQPIADITGGEYFHVPGVASVAESAQDLKGIFGEIASVQPLTFLNLETFSHPERGRLPGGGCFPIGRKMVLR